MKNLNAIWMLIDTNKFNKEIKLLKDKFAFFRGKIKIMQLQTEFWLKQIFTQNGKELV
ncbi:hypothetical protein [Sulfurimonas indica]|uniref:hypothetical protein n=1 Tax=Sulfurimonas TaxID=202746 RepID=UPI00165FF20E|nr:hypothetical protein [Sulfurimonas indica]